MSFEKGGRNVKFNQNETKDRYPFPNTTIAALFAFTVKWQLSRKCLPDSIAILCLYVNEDAEICEGEGQRIFDTREVLKNTENFVARTRQYIPFLDAIKPRVKLKSGHQEGGKTHRDC